MAASIVSAANLVVPQASATWSIVAVDRTTGRIAIALASCVDAAARDGVKLTAIVVPGKGAAVRQAETDPSHADRTYIFNALRRGDDPTDIVAHLRTNAHFSQRQYGMVDVKGRHASASGSDVRQSAGDITARVPGTAIVYAVQGNIVTDRVVPAMADAFATTNGSLLDRAVTALEAGDRAGGDTRCECPPTGEERDRPPCDDMHARVAYLVMADRTTPVATSPEKQRFTLQIGVSPPGTGEDAIDFAKGESANPVKTLRLRYDGWRRNEPDE